VQEAWAAYRAHEGLQDDRCAFFPDYTPHEWAEVWRDALTLLLDNLRTPSAEGIKARLTWMREVANLGYARDTERDVELIDAMEDDFNAFMTTVQTGHRSSSAKAAQVKDLLVAEPHLSDREIARRLSVSPQTVGNWRRRLKSEV
jgi:DNA-binding transcriptional regulator YiaG